MLSVNGYKVEPTIFPDGTSQVWKLPKDVVDADRATITWIFESEAELVQLAQLVRLLPTAWVDVVIPYLPYGRQDKDVANDATFALHVFATMLNKIAGITTLTTFDVHSRVAPECIWGLKVVAADNLIETIAADFDLVCFPDEGARKRYKLAKPSIVGEKVRDQATGHIVSYRIRELDFEPETRILVVDDICDGGATFIKLGEALNKRLLTKPSLYVSHGIFSKGLEPLWPYYHKIITTDSRPTKYKELTVYESAPPHRLLQG